MHNVLLVPKLSRLKALMSATQYAREGDGSVEGWMTDNVRRRLATSIRRPQHWSSTRSHPLAWRPVSCKICVVWNLLSCKYWYLVKCDVLERWYLVKKICTCSKKWACWAGLSVGSVCFRRPRTTCKKKNRVHGGFFWFRHYDVEDMSVSVNPKPFFKRNICQLTHWCWLVEDGLHHSPCSGSCTSSPMCG